VAPLFKFSTEAQAIAMANDTEFGLAAYVYTRDLARSWRVSEAVEYGIVGLNTGIISTEAAPFGGVKESGMGRERVEIRDPRLHRDQVRLRRRNQPVAPCWDDSWSFSLSTPDIQASLDFYLGLGFTSAEVGDAWSHPYAVVTDGRICLGLHQEAITCALAHLRETRSAQAPGWARAQGNRI